MNAVENQVRELVKVELAAANERFPQFHSQHEGYAVIKEEVEELSEAVQAIEKRLCMLWENVRCNLDGTNKVVWYAANDSINAACEAIQVAAMCKKFLDMHESAD